MLQPRSLLRGEITYSTAKREEVNILHRLGYPNKRTEFLTHIAEKRDRIKAIVEHHLNLESSDSCHVAGVENWRHGSFNVCIFVTIDDWAGKQQPGRRVLLRFPLPYRVGEVFRPGNGDEKIRCEAGTYAWLEENCPDVPIPRLYGFAMSTGETFTRLQHLPFLTRWFQYLRRRVLSWLGRPLPSQHVRHQPESQEYSNKVVGAGYLLIEYIEDTQGEMLSNTWPEKQHDVTLRTTFFRDLSRILLSITRVHLPRIGSFVINNDGFLRMTNRPLTLEIQDLENEEIPTYIPRNYTYSTVESYVMDVLGFHDSRLQNQPNAINDTGDYLYQTAALTAMRTVFPSFFQREHSRGPFVFTLTDLHQSNLFVDENWHITSLVDLEWACSRPIEMVRTPTWLTNKAVDEISEEPEEYDMMRKEFIKVLADEEERRPWAENNDSKLQLSAVMKRSWELGTFWYTLALASPTGLFAVFYKQIQPIFLTSSTGHETFEQIMPWYWARDFVKIAKGKISDRKEYDIQLRKAFGDDSSEDRDIHRSE